MISRAIVQSAIVLINRRMKAERDVTMFVPVCSSVAGMHCIISKERIRRKRRSATTEGGTRCPQRVGKRKCVCPPVPQSFSRTGPRNEGSKLDLLHYGVGDEVGKVASAAEDAVGELASTGGDGVGEVASGAGNTAPPDISNLRCLWLCNFSSPDCFFLSLSAFIFESLGIKLRIWAENCCIVFSLSAWTCAGSRF